jgi:hypothetical protein
MFFKQNALKFQKKKSKGALRAGRYAAGRYAA